MIRPTFRTRCCSRTRSGAKPAGGMRVALFALIVKTRCFMHASQVVPAGDRVEDLAVKVGDLDHRPRIHEHTAGDSLQRAGKRSRLWMRENNQNIHYIILVGEVIKPSWPDRRTGPWGSRTSSPSILLRVQFLKTRTLSPSALSGSASAAEENHARAHSWIGYVGHVAFPVGRASRELRTTTTPQANQSRYPSRPQQ